MEPDVRPGIIRHGLPGVLVAKHQILFMIFN
jgi:hypothetical protein